VAITRAGPERLTVVATVLGRAFVTEPMMCWPLGPPEEDLKERLVQSFEYFLETLIELGMVWEADRGAGAAVWIPPDQRESWEEAQIRDRRVYALMKDGGRRWDGFWEWVASRIPDESLWHLDSVGVAPEMQGRGIGSALIEFGLGRVRVTGNSAVLETGSSRNLALYERYGFRVMEDLDPPGGGPHVWFMRWNQ